MSYDLMVFDPDAAPRERAAFLVWYEQQAEWTEDHGYSDPAVTTPALRCFYESMQPVFPAMNTLPDDFDDDDEIARRATDYSIGRHVIYAAFAWSMKAQAYNEMRRCASRAGVGFFDVSGTERIWFPDSPLSPG